MTTTIILSVIVAYLLWILVSEVVDIKRQAKKYKDRINSFPSAERKRIQRQADFKLDETEESIS